MKQCNVKNAIQYGENLTAFGAGEECNLTDIQKLHIELFLGQQIMTKARCYDRFIDKHSLYHGSFCKSLKKRLNCVVQTEEGNFLSITTLLLVKTELDTNEIIALCFEFQKLNEVVCKNNNYSSSSFSVIVKETENIKIIRPSKIENKCICIPYGEEKLCLMPLVNTMETDYRKK